MPRNPRGRESPGIAGTARKKNLEGQTAATTTLATETRSKQLQLEHQPKEKLEWGGWGGAGR